MLEPLSPRSPEGHLGINTTLHPLLLAVIGRLRADEFLSGEVVARDLGVSRASVHGLIRSAGAYGVRVHTVRPGR